MSDSDNSILSAIELGQYSYAQGLLSRKLKKFPNKSYYWAMNCYLLVCLGKVDQALEQSNTLKQKVPSDPHALELLQKVYELLQKPKDANLIYENAVKKYPSADLIDCWFNMAVNKGDIRVMQKAALAFQKHKKDDRAASFRAAFCCLNPARSNVCQVSQQEATLFASIGEKLLEPYELATASTQELFVYCSLLKVNSKHEAICKSIEAYKGTMDLDLQLIYLDALENLETWEGLYKYAKNLLFEVNFNDFDTWRYLIRAAKKQGTDYSKCQETISLYKPATRNSQLAAIEAAKVYDQPMDSLILDYYNNFSGKLCCYPDIISYTATPFIDTVKELTISVLKGDATDIKSLIKLVNNQKFVQRWDTSLEESEFVTANWAIYHKFSALLKQKVETDAYPANELILMNIALSLKDSSLPNIVGNIITLEHLLESDPQDFKLRLLLTHLYSSISCSSLAVHNYNKLKIKMFQHESLSHVIVDSMTPTKANLQELVNIYRFYLTSEGELSDSIPAAFTNGIYNKLESFILFAIKLRESLSRNVLLLQIIKFSRILNDHLYLNYFSRIVKDQEYQICEDTLQVRDNRDYSTLWAFGTHEKKNTSIIRGKEFVQLQYVKELLILENNYTATQKLIKLFNKLMSSKETANQLTAHEQWILKLLLTLFKLYRQPPSKEADSLVNFLVKNLKLDRAKQAAKDSSLNLCLFDVLEVIKIFEAVSRNGQFKSDVLRKAFTDFLQELKGSNLTQPLISDVSEVSVDAVPHESTKEIIEMIQKSLKESSHTKCT